MPNFLVEMCKSCLREDVPLFETMEGETNNKKVKNSTIIQDLFRMDIIDEWSWKLCEDCTMLLKGAIFFKKGLLSSKLIYNNYLKMFDGNNHISSNTFSNLSVQIQDINVTKEEKDLVKVITYITVEESTADIIDGCLKTEFQLAVGSLEGDVIDTKIKIEIDEPNYENVLNDYHCVAESSLNIKTEAENDIVLGSTENNMEVSSNAALLERSSKHLHLNVGVITNAGIDCNNSDNEAKHRTLNSEEKLLICSICDQKFTKNQSLVEHLRVHHDIKSYTCDLCTKIFSQQSGLVRHRRIHTGEKPYKCDLCTKAFSQKSCLNRHRWVHTGEKPYKCNLCGNAFTTIYNYNVHKRVHTGEKPFKCDLCTKTFSRKQTYHRHRRIHTGGKPLQN